jgi:signal transduction histidine kinase
MLGMRMITDYFKQLNPQPDASTLELVEDMFSSSYIAVDILNDLLMYEKIEGNLLNIEFDKVYAPDLINNVIKLFKIQVNT